MNTYLNAISASVLVAAGGLGASAAVMPVESYSSTSQLSFPVSNTDLIEDNSGAFTAGSSLSWGDLARLTDGSLGNSGDTLSLAMADHSWGVTYTLDTSVNTHGYNITGINAFTGWEGERALQIFTVKYTVVGDATLYTLGTVTSAFNQSFASQSVKMALTDDGLGGILIAGAKTITFECSPISEYYGPTPPVPPAYIGSAYREFDVIGTPVVPEPAALGLLALGGMALLRRRRA